MEPTDAPLAAKIAQALREAGAPLRAIDIVRRLAAAGTVASKESVNRTLYHGPFTRTPDAGTPTWTAHAPAEQPPADGRAQLAPEGHFAFQVDTVGIFSLRDDLPRERVRAILVAALGAVEQNAAVVRPDASAGGAMVASIAEGLATIILP